MKDTIIPLVLGSLCTVLGVANICEAIVASADIQISIQDKSVSIGKYKTIKILD